MTTGAGPRVRMLPMGVHGDQLAQIKAAERRAAGLPDPPRSTRGWKTRCTICRRTHKPGECPDPEEDVAAVSSAGPGERETDGEAGSETGAPSPTAAAAMRRSDDPVIRGKSKGLGSGLRGTGRRTSLPHESTERRTGARGAHRASLTEEPGAAPAATTTTEGDPDMKGKAKKDRVCSACEQPGHRKDSPDCPKKGASAPAKPVQGGGMRALIEQIVDQRIEKKLRELFA